jgi:uncharacterized protein (TIGR02466 family)
MKHTLLQLFATNVGIFQLDLDVNKFLNLVKKEKFILTNKKRTDQSYTSINNKLLDTQKYKSLKDQINNCFDLYNDRYMQYGCKVVMNNSWATKTLTSQESSWHNHSNSLVSGVVYFQNKSSNIEFENFNKPHLSVPLTNHNIYNSQNYYITPTAGMVIIFPSLVYHKVTKNIEDTRYSIAFNFIPQGKIGNIDNELEL